MPVSFRASAARRPLLATLVLSLLGAAAAQETPAPEARPSTDKPAAPKTAKVGEAAPEFTLKDTAGKEHSLASLTKAGKIVVLEWFNPDCPVSRAYHSPDSVMTKVAAELAGKDVVWLAINSGAPGKQGAGLERNRKAVEEYAISYPVLMDEDGKVGRLYGAKTTPHMYVIGKDGKLAYAGAIDDGTPQSKGKTNLVREAVTALAAGKEVAVKESKAFGCSVKYAD
jgi:peroxiredoxin